MKKSRKTSHTRSPRKNQQPAPSDSEEPRELKATAENEGERPVSQSRRSFLGRVTAAAVAASVVGIPKLIKSQDRSGS